MNEISESIMPPPPPLETELSFEFKGSTKEYFTIWIINLLLSIFTLGLYSPWAKVRSRKYFYQNTHLNGANFDFHADPLKMLIGRLLMSALFITAYFLFAIGTHIKIAIGLFALFYSLLPFLYVRAMRYSHSQTSYRNIRFGFEGSYLDSYKHAIASVFITVISLGLFMFHAIFLFHRFSVNSSRYGESKFHFDGKSKNYFITHLLAALFYFLTIIFIALITVAVTKSGHNDPAMKQISLIAAFITSYLSFLLIGCFYNARLHTTLVSSMSIDGIQLSTKATWQKLAALNFASSILVALTLGLAYPWVAVTLFKYKMENLRLTGLNTQMDQFKSRDSKESAFEGDSLLDFVDAGIQI